MGEQRRIVLPENVSVAVVTIRTLEPDDLRYALAGVDGAQDLLEAVERLTEPDNWVTKLKFSGDLVRLSITHVNDLAVPPPYLPSATYLGWTLRTLEFLRLAFEHLHPLGVFQGTARRTRQT